VAHSLRIIGIEAEIGQIRYTFGIATNEHPLIPADYNN
jgi:hypothetical protein